MCLSIIFLLICSSASLNHGALESDLWMDMQQQTQIDKAAILKTFEIDDHIVDCIDIYKQPAFQHPLLINHTLQLKPNFPGKTNDYISKASIPWNTSKSCPEGSIPIERMQRNGPSRGNLLRRGLQQRNIERPNAYSTINIFNEKYSGGKATLNVWNPKVEQGNGYSASQVSVTGDDNENVIEAGWMVHPHMYGGTATRFFIFWTVDRYKNTGCYNLQCPGFVQTNHDLILDSYLRPISVYDGEQYTIDVDIRREPEFGHWWVTLQGHDMGYWPEELLPFLSQGADGVSVGGVVDYFLPGPRAGTEMGSGHFAGEGFKKSAFIKNIEIYDPDYGYKNPPTFLQVTQDRGCYDLHVSGNTGGSWGQFLYYGGPGSSATCI